MARHPYALVRTRTGVCLGAAGALLWTSLIAAHGAAHARPLGPRSILVRFAHGAGAEVRDRAVRAGGGSVVGEVFGLPVDVVRVPAGSTARELLTRYRGLPSVAYAEPNRRVRAADAPMPDDPSFDQQWGLHNTGQLGGIRDADIDAPEGWAAAGMSSPTSAWQAAGGAPIGIVDSGIDTSHREFAGRVAGCVHRLDGSGAEPLPGCEDTFGHGTHVAGIAAATTDNGTGVAGVAFASPILVCRALDRTGTGFRADVTACIVWLHDHGAQVINMSITQAGGRVIRDAIRTAWKGGGAEGSVLVAAAGNTGGTRLEHPAGFGAVVSAAATTASDARASFSTQNADVEVAAPGLLIYSTFPGGYGSLSGTSMASAFVSGVVAVIWSVHPDETASEVRTALHAAVDDLGTPGRDHQFGFGRVNLCAAAGDACLYRGGTATVYGTVSAESGEPVVARLATSDPAAPQAHSGPDGHYVMSGLVPGTYRLAAKARGCRSSKETITVAAGDLTHVDFAPTCR
jgi:thermitase